METIEIKKKALVLDKAEIEGLIECLKYCRHRLTEHPTCGLRKVTDWDFVAYSIRKLEEMK